MADRRFRAVASLVLLLAVLLAGMLGPAPMAAGEGPAQGVTLPEAATRLSGSEEVSPKPPAASGQDPIRILSQAEPSVQPQMGTMAPGALTMSYWVWIASADQCGIDYGGIVVVADNRVVVADVLNLCEDENTGGWVKRTADLSGFSGRIQVQVRAETWNEENSNLWVDDVKLDLSGPGIAGFSNGGFEAGRNGVWLEYNSLADISQWPLILNSGWPGTVRPHAGTWAAWLGGWPDPDYLGVTYVEQGIRLPYRVKLPIVMRQTATTDPYEPNNTFAQAWGPLQSGSTYSAYLLQGDADKVDYYFFDLPAAHSIEAWLTNIPTGSDYDLYLYDAAHALLASSTTIGTGPEELDWASGTAQRYYLRVTREAGGSPTQAYALRVVFR